MDENQKTTGSATAGRGSNGGNREAGRDEDRSRPERVVSRSVRAELDEEPIGGDEAVLGLSEARLVALRDALDTQLRERPYTTLACAVGAGVLLGQALSTRLGRVALLAAGGYAATRFLRADGLGALSGLLGEDIDDDDPE